MSSFKDKYGLTTNAGFNAFAVLVPAMGIIDSMPDNLTRSILLGLVVTVTAFIGWLTKGNPPPEPPEATGDEPVSDVLKEGRG